MIEVAPSKWVKVAGAKCYECPLQRCHFVAPHIPANPVALVVGESPGATEVVKGVAFTGDSGKVLDVALVAADVDPAQVARTNAILCRPNNNHSKADLKQALQCCSGALQATIEQNPNTPVVSCGAMPLEALRGLYPSLPGEGIMTLRGSQFGRIGLTVNPAYVLRNSNFLATFKSDVKKFLTVDIDDQTDYTFNWRLIRYEVIDDFDQLRLTLGKIKPNSALAFDVETDDLQYYDTLTRKKAEFLCLVLAVSYDKAYIITPNVVKARPDLWSSFFASMTTIAQNGKFDQEVLAQFDIKFNLKFDTMLAHYTLNENKGTHGLKQLATEYLGCENYEKDLIDDWFTANKITKKNRKYSLLPKDRLYQYAAIDACVTLQLASIFVKQLADQGLVDWPFTRILMPLSNALVDVETTGIKVDRDWLLRVRQYLDEEMYFRHMEMEKLLEFQFNPSAPKQVSNILYTRLGLKLTKRLLKPTGTNTGKEALEALPNHPFVNLLREYRRIEKMQNTYVEKLLTLADVNDRVHINFNIHGTEIGRLSANDSLHGIPRPDDDVRGYDAPYGAMIRSAFIADEGNVLVIGDYSQAELRVFAANSKEPKLLNAYHDGIDVHNQTCEMLENLGAKFFKGYSKLDVKKKKSVRVVGKNVNFGGLCYQGGAVGISGMLGGLISIDELKEILKFFRQAYPVAFEYAESQYQFLRKHGYVKTRFNRYRRMPIINRDNEDECRKLAVHMVTASEAGDLTNLSVVELTRHFKLNNLKAKVVHSIHDSIIVECSEDIASQVAAIVKLIMEDLGNMFIPDVPWIVDIDQLPDGSYPKRWVERPNLDE